jgi:hypothetical protein
MAAHDGRAVVRADRRTAQLGEHMARTGRGIAIRLLLIVVLLTFPLWGPPLMRRVDTQRSRRELAVEMERSARAGGELVRRPSGEVVRAVVYTPADASDAQATRSLTWMARLVALALFLQIVASAYDAPEREPELDG